MTAYPEIVLQRTSGELSLDASGAVDAFTEWSVHAPSELDALVAVKTKVPLLEGVTVYQNPQGQLVAAGCICRKIRCRPTTPAPIGGTGIYLVRAEFSTRSSSSTSAKKIEKGKPAGIFIETESSELPYSNDFAGRPLENVCQEPLDPAPTRPNTTEVLVFRWYMTGITQVAASILFRPFRNKVNSTTFMGAPKGCFYCRNADPVEQDDGSIVATVKLLYAEPFTPNLSFVTYITPSDDVVGFKATAGPFEGHARIYPHRGFRKRVTGIPSSPAPAYDKQFKQIVEKTYDSETDSFTESKIFITQPIYISMTGQPLDYPNKCMLVTYPFKYADFSTIPFPPGTLP